MLTEGTNWLPLAMHGDNSFLVFESATQLTVIALNCPSLCERKTCYR
jgi:hypothetical protein